MKNERTHVKTNFSRTFLMHYNIKINTCVHSPPQRLKTIKLNITQSTAHLFSYNLLWLLKI